MEEKIDNGGTVHPPTCSEDDPPSNLNSQITSHLQQQSPVNIATTNYASGNSGNGSIHHKTSSAIMHQRIESINSSKILDDMNETNCADVNENSNNRVARSHAMNKNNLKSNTNTTERHFLVVNQPQQHVITSNNKTCNPGLVRSVAPISNMPPRHYNLFTGINDIENDTNAITKLLNTQNALRRQLEELTTHNIQLTTRNSCLKHDLDQAVEKDRHMMKMQRLRNQQLLCQSADYESLQKKYHNFLKEKFDDADDKSMQLNKKDRTSNKIESEIQAQILNHRIQQLETENNALKGSVQKLEDINKDLENKVNELSAIFERAGNLLFKNEKNAVTDNSVTKSRTSGDVENPDSQEKEINCCNDANPPVLKHQVTNEHIKTGLPILKRQETQEYISLRHAPSNISNSLSSKFSNNLASKVNNTDDKQTLPSELNRQVSIDIPLKKLSKQSSLVDSDRKNINMRKQMHDNNSREIEEMSSLSNYHLQIFPEGRDHKEVSASSPAMSMPKINDEIQIERDYFDVDMSRKLKNNLLLAKTRCSLSKDAVISNDYYCRDNYHSQMDKTFSVSASHSKFINFSKMIGMAAPTNDHPIHHKMSLSSRSSTSVSTKSPTRQITQKQGQNNDECSTVDNVNKKRGSPQENDSSMASLEKFYTPINICNSSGDNIMNKKRSKLIENDKNKQVLYQYKRTSEKESSEAVKIKDTFTGDDEKSSPSTATAISSTTNAINEFLSTHLKNADAATINSITRQLIEIDSNNAYQYSSFLHSKEKQHAQLPSIPPLARAGDDDRNSKKRSVGSEDSEKDSNSLDHLSRNQEETPQRKRLRGRPRRDKSEGWPKRPLSAYNMFFREQRVKILEELSAGHFVGDEALTTDDPEKMAKQSRRGRPYGSGKKRRRAAPHGIITFEELAKKMSLDWKNATPEIKSEYQNRANENMKKYQDDLALFLQNRAIKDGGNNSKKNSEE